MPLFVVLRGGLALGAAMKHNIRAFPLLMERYSRAIEASESRRFLPNEIFALPGKSARIVLQKQDLPIRKLLPGQPIEKSHQQGFDGESGLLDWWVAFAGKFRQS